MQVLCWTLQDKSPLQPGCFVAPLWWMLSNGHWCESQRPACFVPLPQDYLQASLLHLFVLHLSLSRLLTKLQTHSQFPRNLSCCPPSWWSGICLSTLSTERMSPYHCLIATPECGYHAATIHTKPTHFWFGSGYFPPPPVSHCELPKATGMSSRRDISTIWVGDMRAGATCSLSCALWTSSLMSWIYNLHCIMDYCCILLTSLLNRSDNIQLILSSSNYISTKCPPWGWG